MGANEVAKSLDGRLLCASQCSYKVESPYFPGAGFITGTQIKRLSKGVNSVIIGKTKDGIVLAFRGTMTTSALDWLQNAAVYLSRVSSSTISNENGKNITNIVGRIHSGFYRAVVSLWDPIKEVLTDLLKKEEGCEKSCDARKIFLTGHSKGGALASIAAILLNREPTFPNATYVCTFGSAKFGDSTFRDAYNKEINQTTYESYLDLIPFLPISQSTAEAMDDEMMEMVDGIIGDHETASVKGNKSTKKSNTTIRSYKWDYQAVGTRKYIDKDGSIVTDVTKELDDQRIRDIEEKTLLSINAFRAAHSASCPPSGKTGQGGYFRAVANDVCEWYQQQNAGTS